MRSRAQGRSEVHLCTVTSRLWHLIDNFTHTHDDDDDDVIIINNTFVHVHTIATIDVLVHLMCVMIYISDMCINAHKFTNIMRIVEDPLFKVLELMTEFESHCCLGATICRPRRMYRIMNNITCDRSACRGVGSNGAAAESTKDSQCCAHLRSPPPCH